jgi:phosphohistidine phosphatase
MAGRWLAESLGVLDLVVVSPAVRARSTWDLVAAELKVPVPVHVDDRVSAASADDLLAVVRGLPDDARTAVMVGHNPGLEDLVPRLTGEQIAMKTSAIAVIKLSGGWATAGHSPAKLVAAGRPPDASSTRGLDS